MKFDVNVNHSDRATAERLVRIEKQFSYIARYLEKIYMTFDDLKALQEANAAKIDAVVAHIGILNDQVAANAANEAALAEAVAREQALADKLAGIGG